MVVLVVVFKTVLQPIAMTSIRLCYDRPRPSKIGDLFLGRSGPRMVRFLVAVLLTRAADLPLGRSGPRMVTFSVEVSSTRAADLALGGSGHRAVRLL